MLQRFPSQRFRLLVLLGCLCGVTAGAAATMVFREPLEPGILAAIKGGRVLYLECRPPKGDAAKPFLENYLADPRQWKQYRNRLAVAIPYDKLSLEAKRAVLLAIFPEDYSDEDGWWHTVVFQGEEGMETWWCLSEWFTGIGTRYREIRDHERNRRYSGTLEPGHRILIPKELLLDVLKRPTPKKPVAEGAPALKTAEKELAYGSDAKGEYAVYRLKKDEALYTAVVVRFTDFRDNEDILKACEVIQARSGIRDVHRMTEGQQILIPIEMLSDRYRPAGSQERIAYEAVREEARRLKAEPVHSKGLEGVVLVLDPGHGGRDHGAAVSKLGLYEDELNYDIACRVKRLLEAETRAKIHVTVRDRSQGYSPSNEKRFTHDTDEELLTTPPYNNEDAKISANLRWYLANDLYRKEIERGTNERKILFVSLHCDAIFNEHMRGAMVYVPGAKYRRAEEKPSSQLYDRYDEARGHRTFTSTPAIRRRDEALSRNFATTLLDTLANNKPPIKVHSTGDPVRSVIRQRGGRAYIPAVIRNAIIPTKVLVETANLTNVTDQQRLANPKWRQWFAEAFVQALKTHFDSG